MGERRANVSRPRHRAGNKRNLVALLVVALLSPLLCGQTNSEPTSGGPAIKTSAEEVSLDLVVRDKKGHLVNDLKPADIAVTDNGSPVKISDLHIVTGESTTMHPVTLVFDQLDSSSARNARNVAEKILKTVPEKGFTFAVLNVEGGLRLCHGFTPDRGVLEKAVAPATEGGKPDSASDTAFSENRLIASGTDASGVRVNPSEREMAHALLAALDDSQRTTQEQHGQPGLTGLLALVRAQKEIPQRKVVIYIAQGLQPDSNTNDMLKSIMGEANRAGVSIYVVDLNALDWQASQKLMTTIAMGNMETYAHLNPPPTGINTPQEPTPAGMRTSGADQVNRFETDGMNLKKTPLAELATGTGGAYIGGEDSLKKPLKQMVEDMTIYYEASYAPSIENYDGQFRPIVVKPLRTGLIVRYRAGYYALPPDGGFRVRPFETPLLKILATSPLPTDLKFRSSILRMGKLPDGNANALVVEVPLEELEMKEDANTSLYSVHLSIVAQIKGKTGTVIEHFSEDIPRRGALEAMEGARSEVVTLQRHFIAAPGDYVLEAAIIDQNSGKAGAERITFNVPAVSSGPLLSDIALVRKTEPLPREADSSEPLRYEDSKVVPNLSGQVSHDARNISLFFVVHPDVRTAEPATLEMEIIRNGNTVARMPLTLRKSNGTGGIPYLATMRASSLPAGRYEVTTFLTQGGATAERSASFTVDTPELASAVAPITAGETGPVSDTSAQPLPGEIHGAGRLVITPLVSSAIPPALDEQKAMIAAVRERALSYAASLPNFICIEVTNRSVDSAGNGKWKHKDTIAELLRYRDNAETRTTLEVNGKPSNIERADLQGTISHGEFGGVLNAVFAPMSKAEFQWKEADALGSGTVQVFNYRVVQGNSDFGITGDNNRQLRVGFHGLVYVDGATKGVRRITLEADDLPRDFSIHATAVTVDYDYIAINNHDYLMPIRGTVALRQGKREAVLNEMDFRDYKRFGSRVRILPSETNP